jgi:hypothetical protein
MPFLREGFTGALYADGEPGYEEARTIFNKGERGSLSEPRSIAC